jgi:antitoxin PrlF
VPEATLTSKGQNTLPLEVRQALGLTTGARVALVRTDDGAYELIPATASVKDLRGTVRAPGRLLTLDELDAAVAEGAADRWSS